MKHVREAATYLKEGGLPVAVISDLCGVGRLAVSGWLEGRSTGSLGEERLMTIRQVLGEANIDLRFLWRLWNRPSGAGASLYDLLKAERLDRFAILQACVEMGPVVARYAAIDATRSKIAAPGAGNPVLAEIPVADLRRR